MAQKTDCESKSIGDLATPGCLILWAWSNKQKIRPAFGDQRKQSMSAVECSMADKGMDQSSNPQNISVRQAHFSVPNGEVASR